MSKKNKDTSLTPLSTSPPRDDRTDITDATVWELVKKTSTRCNVSEATLVEMACDALLGSIDKYGYKYKEAWDGKRKASTRGPVDQGGSVKLPPAVKSDLNAAAVYFGINASDLLRDALLAQRFNWQRLQPVNARSMSSLRLQMFELEQLGTR